MDIAKGPATEWKRESNTLWAPDIHLEQAKDIFHTLIEAEKTIKEQIQTGHINPRLMAQLGWGYQNLNITMPDPDSEDITATITGKELAKAFIEAYTKTLPKSKSVL